MQFTLDHFQLIKHLRPKLRDNVTIDVLVVLSGILVVAVTW